MTEKRYVTHTSDAPYISYTYIESEDDLIECMTDACDELNRLSDENEQLKQEMGDLGTVHAKEINKIEDEFDDEILKLEKENEQLKSEIRMLKTTIGRNEAYIKRIKNEGKWRV